MSEGTAYRSNHADVIGAWASFKAASESVRAGRAALRSLITPPRPDRPDGWGAVVEDDTGAFWTLFAPEADLWINYREGRRQWPAIAAVRVLSEGVTE